MTPLFPRPDRLPKATATKGVHFFDINYFRGERWYRSFLPTGRVRARQAEHIGRPVITGEASPYYLYHPAAPQRAAELLPAVKIIAVLREPSARAYSHWKERRREGAETLDFAAAIDAERERLGAVDEQMLMRPDGYSYAHEQQSYVAQGEYDTAIERWLAHIPRERLLVVASEDYYAQPAAELGRALDFLELDTAADFRAGGVRNAAPAGEIPADVHAMLLTHFKPHNERLQVVLNQSLPWG